MADDRRSRPLLGWVLPLALATGCIDDFPDIH